MTIHNPLAKRIAEEKKEENTMSKKQIVCPKCGSHEVQISTVNEVKLKNQHHSVFWWLFIGWWWVPVKWLYLTIPALVFKLFGNKKQKAINKYKTIAVCQRCGNSWEI